MNYGGAEGVGLGVYSLRRLTEYYRFQTGNAPSAENRPFAVSPHQVAHYQTTSSLYAVISNSSKALLVDYGAASGCASATPSAQPRPPTASASSSIPSTD